MIISELRQREGPKAKRTCIAYPARTIRGERILSHKWCQFDFRTGPSVASGFALLQKWCQFDFRKKNELTPIPGEFDRPVNDHRIRQRGRSLHLSGISPERLASGSFRPAPRPSVVGNSESGSLGHPAKRRIRCQGRGRLGLDNRPASRWPWCRGEDWILDRQRELAGLFAIEFGSLSFFALVQARPKNRDGQSRQPRRHRTRPKAGFSHAYRHRQREERSSPRTIWSRPATPLRSWAYPRNADHPSHAARPTTALPT